MSNMCIEVEFLAGTSIDIAADEAIDKANLFNVAYIKFNFNGVNISVGKNATRESVEDAYFKSLQNDLKFAVVNK